MTMTSERSSARTAAPRRRLGRRLRRTTLVVHLVSAGTWIGIDVVVAVLVLAGRFGGDAATRGIAYQALSLFIAWPMLISGLICLVSGVILGIGTPWGLIRYWWVAVKLAINVVLCILIIFVLQPGMADIGAYGRDLAAGVPTHSSVSTLFFPPAVSLTALSLATLLSVFKPWGRTRR
jgi:hypothetical protein